MNENLLKKLLYTGKISFEKGNFSALGHRFVFISPEFLVFLGQELSGDISSKKTGRAIQESARKMVYGIGEEMVRIGIDKNEIPSYLSTLLSAYGWGDINILESNRDSALIYYKNGPTALMPDRTNVCRKEICEFIKGSISGAFEIALNKRVDCRETRCMLNKSHFCQFSCSTIPNKKR